MGEEGADHVGWHISLSFTSSRRHAFEDADGAGIMVKAVDASAWAYLLKESGLQSFLDTEARKKWQEAIETGEVPALTRPNIEATFAMLYDSLSGRAFECSTTRKVVGSAVRGERRLCRPPRHRSERAIAHVALGAHGDVAVAA